MRFVRVLALAAVFAATLHSQFAAASAPDVLLVGRFRTPLTYEAVLQRLDDYYQEQVARKLATAFPRIAPQTHYETWHEMWVSFGAEAGALNVTLKRQTSPSMTVIAKGWMLQIAGRTGGEMPLKFEELPGLHSAQGQVFGSRRELAGAVSDQPSLQSLGTGQYAGLLVSAAPMMRVTLESAGQRGAHHLTVAAETAPAARQLVARISSAMTHPCVCAAYSETAELDEELRKGAIEKSEDVNSASQRIYFSRTDPKILEQQQRAEPETQKRLAAAAGWVGIKYRVEKPYAKVHIQWTELAGYVRDGGKFDVERPLGASTAVNVRMPGTAGAQLTGRTRLNGALKPGAYRILLEGETAAGERVRIDCRDYWFDGKAFEEI